MPKPHGRMSPRGIEHQLRLAKAIKMKLERHTWDEIAEACGWNSRSAAWQAVNKELDRRIQEPTDRLVQMELEKLDELEAELLPQAMKPGKRQASLASAEVRLMARRAKLRGLDDFDRRSIELAERRNALDKQQSTLVYEFMNRVFDRLELTEAQRAMLPDIVPDEMAKITTEAGPSDMGELEEIPEDTTQLE